MIGRRLKPGEKEILSHLREGPKIYTELRISTGLSGSVLAGYLKKLYSLNLIDHDYLTRRYSLKEDGHEFLRFAELRRALEGWKLEHGECLVAPVEFEPVEGLPPTGEIEFLYQAMLYEDKPDAFSALYRWRTKGSGEALIKGILSLARARGLLDEGYFDGSRSWGDISSEEWAEAIMTLFPHGRKVYTVQEVNLDIFRLGACDPAFRSELGRLWSEDPSLPDVEDVGEGR